MDQLLGKDQYEKNSTSRFAKLFMLYHTSMVMRNCANQLQTPLERVLQTTQADPPKGAQLKTLRGQFDPFALSWVIDQQRETLSRMASTKPGRSVSPGACAAL